MDPYLRLSVEKLYKKKIANIIENTQKQIVLYPTKNYFIEKLYDS